MAKRVLVAAIVMTVVGATAAVGAQTTVLCMGQEATVQSIGASIFGGGTFVGTSADDVIIGTDKHDYIEGGGGDDLICGRAGDDNIHGEAGNDRIFGGWGRDIVNAGDGDDFVRGGPGDDLLKGNLGRDRIYGDGGNDSISAFGSFFGGDPWRTDNRAPIVDVGGSWLFGGEGKDLIEGGSGWDRIFGGAGDDLMFGYQGNDYIRGGIGDDLIHGDASADTIRSGQGNDLLFIEFADIVDAGRGIRDLCASPTEPQRSRPGCETSTMDTDEPAIRQHFIDMHD